MKKTLVRNALLALLVLVSVGLIVLMVNGDLDRNTKLAGIAGLFVALAALLATVIKLFPTAAGPTRSASDSADDLADTVQAQWYEEATVRHLRDPKVLPLTWSTGRMDGRFDETTRQLADGYREVRSGRLVVLGEPGSGKTVLAILLTLGLLSSRSPGSAVPVLLAASSWDPIQESMDDWVIRTLAAEYYNGQQDIPRTLHHQGLLLPILDGLDEIPESARRSAVAGINEAIGADRPVVVTCRSAEYDDVIEGGAPVLRKTPVVRVASVPVGDVIAYLKEVPSWPNGTSWDAIFADLQHRPDGPIAAALSTPLMVSLARTVYQRCGGDPAEMLDASRFDSRHKVEDYLIDRVIDAVYAPDLLPSGEPADAPVHGWDAAKARRWLTFLARYLHQHRERDLAWWRLSDRLVSPWMAPGIGIVLGVVLMILASAGMAALGSDRQLDNDTTYDALGIGVFAGGIAAVLGTILWYGAVGQAPGRMAFVVRGSLGRLRRGFAAGAALVAILAAPVLFGAVVVLFISDRSDPSLSTITGLVMGLTVAVALTCVAGLAVAVHNWLNALPERSVQASPFSFVQQDRRSSLVGALAAGIVAGVTMVPAISVAVFIGQIFGQGTAGWIGKTGTVEFIGAVAWFDLSPMQIFWFPIFLPCVGVTLLVLLTRAWPRFVLARALLAARGDLPWRLLTFFADARRRDLLRQSGGMYQFRHIRLQERLAAQPGVATRGPESPKLAPATVVRRQRVIAMAGAGIIASTVVVALSTFNYLRCDWWWRLGTDVDRVRSFTGSESLCIGIVPEADWGQLSPNRAVFDRLRAGNEAAARGNAEVSTIAVLGALRTPDPDVTLRQLDGVVLAQHESQRIGQPVRVVLVDTGGADFPSKEAALERVSSLGSRPGVNRLAVVDLGPTPSGLDCQQTLVNDEFIPASSADIFRCLADRRVSPRPDVQAVFDQQLRDSLMIWFIRYTLKSDRFPFVEYLNESSPGRLSFRRSPDMCASVETSVVWREAWPELSELLLGLVGACEKNHVRLVVTDDSTVEYIQRLPVQGFSNLTVYYPVAGAALVARRCNEVASEVLPSRAGVCDDDDIVTEFSYRATLNAAGKGNFVVHEMRADENRWITRPFQR